MIKIHTHDGVTRLQHRKLDCHICLCAGVRLDIGVIAAKQLLCTLYGKIFHDIHALAAAVIALSRISLRILVRQRASHRRHDRLTHPVLGSDQLDMAVLTLLLCHDSVRDLRIYLSYFI